MNPDQKSQLFRRFQEHNARGTALVYPPAMLGDLRATPGVLCQQIKAGVCIVSAQNPQAPYDWVQAHSSFKPKADLDDRDRRVLRECAGAMGLHHDGIEALPCLLAKDARRAWGLPGVVVAMDPVAASENERQAGRYPILAVEDPERPGTWLTVDPQITAALAYDALRPERIRFWPPASKAEPAAATLPPTGEEIERFRARRREFEAVLDADPELREARLHTARFQGRSNEEDLAKLACGWMEAGIDLEEVRAWVAAKLLYPQPAIELRAAGITAAEAGALTSEFDPAAEVFHLEPGFSYWQDREATIARKYHLGVLKLEKAVSIVAEHRGQTSVAAYVPAPGEAPGRKLSISL